ncbi:putative dehydrogenase [Abditibacterium utsteinense]|uniref:Putative dehydrogenase n=1 Tax=Abditibacterium utsteinense TaxID=1960156 RepID=A0A2S8SP12_9BACT|nr:Gfo/Idh/MocA family oxidoreductase [Abditibacterium utsteinense]PQV62530.1 putative dehydrogenase [Abditibacterium utsteinense]
MPKIRVLQVGCGGISNVWLPPATQFPDVEIAGLVDLNPDAAQACIQKIGLNPETPIFTDLKTALSEVSPDAVFDCTIPLAHTPTALLSFEHGAHVLSEKPMSDTLDGATQALDAAKNAGKIYAVIQNYRYANGPRRLKQFLDTKIIGDVTTVNADMYLGAHFGGFRDEMEHVLLLDMAIHTFDMARFLSGTDPLSVFCHEWNPKGSWYAHDASASAIFEMTEGVVSNFRGSWCATGLPSDFASSWRIIGERGTVLWDGKDGFSCEVEAGSEGFQRPVQKIEVPDGDFGSKAQGHGGVIREFLDAIQSGGANGEAPETRAEDNIKSLKMVLGAVESSRSGAKVRL